MAKVMLIIEKPKCCAECQMHYKDSEGFPLCYVKRTPYVIEDETIVQEWCPLPEVPKKKEDNLSIHIPYNEGYLKGWNDCVEEILGEKEK